MKTKLTLAAAVLCVLASPTYADSVHRTANGFIVGAAGHAPIGVMGDHMHKKGEWMVSYRFMHMAMHGMRDGTNDLSANEVLTASAANPTNYAITPTQMRTDMHMLGGMYAPTDNLTLMIMGGFTEKEMDHLMDSGQRFTTSSSGMSDTKISGLFSLYETPGHHWHANFGVSLPTGSTNERDATPMMPAGMRLPFGMQTGSGTLDLLPGVTYNGHSDAWHWGGQYSATLRGGKNSEDYRLGNEQRLSAWGAYEWAPWISTSLRLSGQQVSDVDGDAIMGMPMMNPGFDPENYGGKRLDLSLGVNLMGQAGAVKGHRLGFEITAPVYENLNGPQMSSEWMALFGWQKAF